MGDFAAAAVLSGVAHHRDLLLAQRWMGPVLPLAASRVTMRFCLLNGRPATLATAFAQSPGLCTRISMISARQGVYERREADWRNGAIVYQVLVDHLRRRRIWTPSAPSIPRRKSCTTGVIRPNVALSGKGEGVVSRD